MWQALSGSTRCCGLVLFWDGAAIAQLGVAAPGLAEGDARPGELVKSAETLQRGNYLANVTLYPGGDSIPRWGLCTQVGTPSSLASHGLEN